MIDGCTAERARLERLAELAGREDDHPEVRLALVREVAAHREAGPSADPAAAVALADRVERWRYQLLNHWVGRMSEGRHELADRLDLVMNDLRRQPPRAPRSLRDALAASTGSAGDDVERCLDPGVPLGEVEATARTVTERHFSVAPGGPSGRRRTMLLYAPLYVANHCINHCLYCGFRYPQPMPRERLETGRAVAEAEELRRRGFREILVVAGEHPRFVTVDYLAGIARELTARGLRTAVEVAPQSTLAYSRLRDAGAAGVTLYQETYNEKLYARYHPKGTKTWYDWRLEGPERAAEAGFRRLGLGVLLGLGDPRPELRALVAHGRYLLGRFPGLALSFGVPRMREVPDGFVVPFLVDDAWMIRLACALRVAFPTASLVLSTRESPALRDRLAGVCVTQMSAGSSTAPGGYTTPADDAHERQQFPIFDHRSPAEVAADLAARGFEVRWELEPATA